MRITWLQRCVQENLFSGRKVGAKFLGVMTKISWTHKNHENAWILNMRVLLIRKFELDHSSGLFRQAILLFTSLRWANWARPGSRKCGRAVVREACFSKIIWNPTSEMQWDVKNKLFQVNAHLPVHTPCPGKFGLPSNFVSKVSFMPRKISRSLRVIRMMKNTSDWHRKRSFRDLGGPAGSLAFPYAKNAQGS